MMFKQRLTKPEKGNKYYIRLLSGGWNDAVLGNPLDKDCDVLANCVGYANGRFAEIAGTKGIKYQFTKNAENFIEDAINLFGLDVDITPSLGGIMVWQAGKTLSGTDGVGHVAIVEEIIDENTILTSESGYESFIFANIVRTNHDGNWSMPYSEYRGCIVNPDVNERESSKLIKKLVKMYKNIDFK